MTGSYKDIQILGTNDFHGRILPVGRRRRAGASVLSGAVKQLRADNPNTLFVAAGDLIGASTFESFIQDDKPTIDALNEAGLDVSAVGNHELDKGYDDLRNRVTAPYDPENNPLGGAEWRYIAANLKLKATGNPAVAGDLDPDGRRRQDRVRRRGHRGPAGAGIARPASRTCRSPTSSTRSTPRPRTCATTAPTWWSCWSTRARRPRAAPRRSSPTRTPLWGNITQNVSSDVDAIVSGHTHLPYNCSVPGRRVGRARAAR